MGQLDGAAELARLGEAYFVTQHSYDPYNATLLGVAEFDQLSFDPSREASERAAQELAAIGRAAREIDTAGLTDDQRVDHGVLTALVEGARSDAEHSLWAANASAKSYVSRPARKSSRSPRTHSTALRQYVTPISSTTTFPPASSRRSTRSMRTTPRWRTTGPRPSM